MQAEQELLRRDGGHGVQAVEEEPTDKQGTLCTDRFFSSVMSLLSVARLAATVSAMHVAARLVGHMCIFSPGAQRAVRV